MEFTRAFRGIGKADASIAGGKGASLGEMTQAGIPVPPGFVILSTTFDHFIQETGLIEEIDAALEGVDHRVMHTVDAASEKIEGLIKQQGFPEDIRVEVLENFKKLGAEFVAVRSSATAEDGAEHAWAGQLDTYLNTTEENLLENVKRCWASLFTPRAIFYRFEKKLHKTKISVAVVIQKMVQSEKAGIAFSVHPVTEDHNQLIIEAGFGLGEAVVSGSVTPDSYVVSKEPREIIDVTINIQNKALYGKLGGGNEWKDLGPEIASAQVLSREEIFELAKVVVEIEKHYGFPCDIEWAFEKEKFYITQSRPITTLSAKTTENKDISRLTSENYDFLWRVGFNYLFCSIYFESGYSERDFIFIWKDGDHLNFVGKEERKNLSLEGLKLYTTDFESFKNRLKANIPLHEAAMEQMRVKTLTKITNKELAEEFSTLTDLILKVFKDYFYLEYHCTDEVARIIEESDKKYEVERIKREVEELGHLKLAIRQIWNKVLYPPNVLAKYADEIAQRFSLGESVSHYRYKELIRMLMGEKVSIPDRSCVVWGKFSNGEDIVGSKAESIIRQLQKVDASSAEFKGSIGNKGYYKGRVKKIEFSAKTDFKKEIEAMNAGDVLVSGSTGPEMILACKKAGAIITDEGGIISHAAIVSRELNIPSVIGTKVATRILKDGDLVEVDADKGVVRLLDQNQQTNLVKKYSLNASTWTYKGFHGVLHTFFPVGQTGGAMQNFFGDSSKITIFFVENDYVHWYWNDNELTRIREEFFEKLKTDSKYLAKLQKEWQSKIANFETITSSIDSTDLTRLSDEELAGLYDRFFAAYVEQFSYFMVLGDAISMHADRYLVPEFEKVLGADFSAIFPELISTKHLSFIEEEAAGRKKLVGIFKESGTISDELLKEHAHKYFYIQNNYARATRLDENDFLAFIKEDVGKPLPEKLISEKKKTDKEKLIKQYHLSDWHKTLIYVMDEFFEIQDTRKKYVLISNYYQFNFLKEAERRSGIPFNLLRYSIYPEYRAILNKTVSTDQLFKRSEVCMCVHEGLNYQILSGEPARTALKFFQDKGVGESKKELKGLIASKGIARGKVKIILKIHDMINMEKGDILVSSMTRPEMTPAMKLAAAIVTDEGGVTSHAAIVSRELGIPCIIGTKQATHILKDGDLVEVDADSGIVRIIS